MKDQEFNGMRDQAIGLFHSQPAKAKDKISLDAIFVSLSLTAAMRGHGEQPAAGKTAVKTAPGRHAAPPEWFTETLEKLKASGEKHINVGRFLLVAQRLPAERMDRINVVRWLREAGIVPRKSGGNLIFDL